MISSLFLYGASKFWCSILSRLEPVDLDVVVGRDGDDLQLLFGRRLEVLMFDPQALGAGAVELAEQRHHTSLLAGTGGTVHQQVGEVAWTSLCNQISRGLWKSKKHFWVWWGLCHLDEPLQVLSLPFVKVKLGQPLGAVFVKPQSHCQPRFVNRMRLKSRQIFSIFDVFRFPEFSRYFAFCYDFWRRFRESCLWSLARSEKIQAYFSHFF